MASRLQEFKTFFGFQLCLKVFSVTEQLSCLLQSKQTSIDTAINQANVLKSHLTRLRSDSEFDLFYKDVEQCATDVTDKPELPRQRRASKRVDPDNSQHQFSTPKDIHRKTYFELLDVMIQEIDRRLSKKALEIPHLIESVLLKSFAKEALPCDAIDKLSQFYLNDLTQDKLAREVTFIPDILQCVRKSEKYKGLKQISSISTICDIMIDFPSYAELCPEIVKLIRIFLTVPVSTATAERFFSSLRRLKTCLRSTMSQERLSATVVLNTYKDKTSNVDPRTVAQKFVDRQDARKSYFGAFVDL